jgi:cell wall-associated NlpC family hydrolase
MLVPFLPSRAARPGRIGACPAPHPGSALERRRRAFAACALAAALACASPRGLGPEPEAQTDPADPPAPAPRAERAAVVQVAESAVGAPYRRGGSGSSGFDCSGLVVYSFARAGIAGLPRSAEDLERAASPVALEELEPGDLLFFRLDGGETSHVAIYVGDRTFVHAPSSGKRVERVDFDHAYWGPRLAHAGRLLD